MLDGAGKAQLILFMYDGDVTIDGVTHPYQWVTVSAQLDSSKLPSGIQSTSDAEGLPSDLYPISWSTTSPELARWLQNSGLGSVARHVAGLTYDLGNSVAPTFTGTASRPDPSPFAFTAQLTPTFLPTIPDTVDFWRDTPRGTVMLQTNDNNERLGGFLNWSLRTEPSTPLAQMLGSTTQTRTCSSANIADPLLGLAAHQVRPGCLSREMFSSTTLSRSFFPSR